MNHATTCKFCQHELVIKIDYSYDSVGDPLKLIPMAACDTCADIRAERRTLEDRLKRVCMNLSRMKTKPKDAQLASIRTALTDITQQYCQLIAKWHNMSGMAWDEVMVDWLIEKPERWGDIMSRVWRQFKISCVPKQSDLIQP